MTQPDWDERFSETGFAYGTTPNSFLVEHAHLLTGPVLSVAEGEGRNAVFLAETGLAVHGVDGSKVGLARARELAKSKGVTITTELADLELYAPDESVFGAVVSIFAHLPSTIRTQLCPRLERSLIKGGVILLEAYSESQLGRGTGGPPDRDQLMTREKIEKEFPGCEPILLREVERDVIEGKYHTGVASVIQFVGRMID